MLNILISLYNGVKDTTGTTLTIAEALTTIKSDELSTKILAISNETDDKKRAAQKAKLPAVTWSGTFTKRKAEALQTYTCIICLDFDKLSKEELTKIREQLSKDALVFAFFYSPSGNGLKVLVKLTSGPAEHKTAFIQLAAYFKKVYGIAADESGKDVCRLCFLSWDMNLFMNENSAAFQLEENRQPERIVIEKSLNTQFDDLRTFTDKKFSYTEGKYNAYVNAFVMNCKGKGIDKSEVEFYCKNAFSDYIEFHTEKALLNIVTSVYENAKIEFGKYKHQPASTQPAKAKANKPTPPPTPGEPTEFNDSVLFWYEVETDKKDKDGHPIVDYKFSYDDCIEFLQNNGYYRYPIENGKYQLIRITGKIVETVERVQIKDFILSFLKSEIDNYEFKKVREMFRRGCKTFLSSETLEGLDYRKPVFERDTEDCKYFYFKEYFLKVTKDKITEHKLDELHHHIWKKQIIAFDLKHDKYNDDAEFQEFLQLAVIEEKETFTDADKKKMLSVYTAIGYMIHMYKHPDLTKAVVAVDKQLRKLGEANGRSGKSLLGKALKYMMPTTLIDAKNFKWDYEFSFQKVDIDTRLINFNDVNKAFDFERLFGMITEEFDWQKKGQQMFTLPFEDSPKFYISTNYSLKGDGDSNKGRQHIIEFSNYFNATRTPFTVFKRRFFTNWDAAEWNKFYLFMINCVKLYLLNGLVDFPLENYELNQFFDTWSEDALDWCDDLIFNNMKHQNELKLEKAEMFKAFKNEFNNWDKIKMNRFSKHLIERYCAIRGIAINAHLNGERDRSNGHDYLTFTAIKK